MLATPPFMGQPKQSSKKRRKAGSAMLWKRASWPAEFNYQSGKLNQKLWGGIGYIFWKSPKADESQFLAKASHWTRTQTTMCSI